MTSTDTRPSSQERFVLNETAPNSPASERFLIRPGNSSQRLLAIAEFERETARRENAKNRASRPGSGELLLNAETLLNAGERSMAMHLVRQALALDSRNPEALRKMLRCLGNRDWEKSQKISIHRALVEIEPTFANFAHCGTALLEAGRLDEALDAYFEATLRVEEEGSLLFEVFKNSGNIHVRKGDFESAEEAYHKAFTLQPDSDVLQVNLGTLAVQKNDWSSARERFQRALEINASNDKAWVGLGLCHQQVGDAHLAQANLENALDICPSNRTAVHLMANWSLQAQSVDRAIERLQDYLATQESDVEMSLVLIHLFCQKQNYEFARIELERALCWEPEREELINLRTQIETAIEESRL